MLDSVILLLGWLAILYQGFSGFIFRLVFGFHSRMSSDSNRTVSSASSVNSTENWMIGLNIRFYCCTGADLSTFSNMILSCTVRVLVGAAPIPTPILTTIRAASARRLQDFASRVLQLTTAEDVPNH